MKPNSPQDQGVSVTENMRQVFIPRAAPMNAQGMFYHFFEMLSREVKKLDKTALPLDFGMALAGDNLQNF